MMRSLADDEARYYTAHSRMTDPAERAPLLDALPADPARLVAAISGLLLHPLFVTPLGIVPPAGSADDVESRTLPRMLDRILARVRQGYVRDPKIDAAQSTRRGTSMAQMLELAATMGGGPVKTFLKIRFPAALPHLFAGLKVAVTPSSSCVKLSSARP